MQTITISGLQKSLTDKIRINGKKPAQTTKESAKLLEFESDVKKPSYYKLRDVIFIRIAVEEELANILPWKIIVNGRVFVRRFDGFYTPENANVEETAAFFDMIADDYDQLIIPSLNHEVYSLLFKKVLGKKVESQSRVLDFGVGTGFSKSVLPKTHPRQPVLLHGVDISNEMVKICRRKDWLVSRIEGTKLPYEDMYFAGMIASFVVHYLFDTSPFEEFYRVLKEDGIIAFNLHVTELDRQAYYHEILNRVGFSCIEYSSSYIEIDSKHYDIHLMSAKKSSKPSTLF